MANASFPLQPPPEFFDPGDGIESCFLCAQPAYKKLYDVRHFGFPFTFQTCQCGLIKQTPMPNEKFFEWFYNSDLFFSSKQSKSKQVWGFYDYFNDEPCRMATSKRRYRKLGAYLEKTKPMEILKIGPSTGTFLHVANQNGHHAIGCDVSSEFVRYAKETYNVHIDHGRFEHFGYKDAAFDAVFLFNVIENIPNPPLFLNAVGRVLKPNGLFILNFVDMTSNMVAAVQKDRYFMFRPPICYVYTMPVLRRALKKAGFDIVRHFRDIRYLHLEKMITLLGWNGLLGFLRFLGIHNITFPIYAYPSRIVVARKSIQ